MVVEETLSSNPPRSQPAAAYRTLARLDSLPRRSVGPMLGPGRRSPGPGDRPTDVRTDGGRQTVNTSFSSDGLREAPRRVGDRRAARTASPFWRAHGKRH
jgi:hypothetical protein